MKVEIKHRFTSAVLVSGDFESLKDCLEKNRSAYLGGADLYGANLRGANLVGAYLRGANLYGANLGSANLGSASLYGAAGYDQSHDIFTEAVRRQPVSLFVDTEWVAIAQITIHRLCWDAIKKRFSPVMPSIFKKLADAGFPEWLTYWNERIK